MSKKKLLFPELKNRNVKFRDAVEGMRRTGECTCWDCLRKLGLTPPKSLRTKFPRKYPHTVFDVDPGGDPLGIATKHRDKDEKDSEAGSTPLERDHLREAVANRAVI